MSRRPPVVSVVGKSGAACERLYYAALQAGCANVARWREAARVLGAGPLRVALGRAVPATPAPAAACGCRVSGTVEVRPGRPVRGRPRVEVSLAGLSAPRDTVTLFMGPPRAFDLGHVPCGRRALEVRPLGPRRFARVEPDSTAFDCVAGGARRFRVVLEPR